MKKPLLKLATAFPRLTENRRHPLKAVWASWWNICVFWQNPGISEAELKQRVQYYLQMQLANQQRYALAQQQKVC